MPLSPRITIPVAAAVLCAGLIVGLLSWQLRTTRATLTQALMPVNTTPLGLPLNPRTTTPDAEAIDTGDAALTHVRAGDLFALRGQWANAEKEYQAAVDAGGGLTALRKLAQAQLQRRDVRSARTTLEQLQRSGARPEDLLLLKSIIDLRTGELEKARAFLTAAPDSPQKHYGLGLLALIGADHETAKMELTLVLSGWETVLRSYARALLAAYEEYALFPESPPIHLQTLLSRALAEVQECELALPMLSQVTRMQDDYRDAWIVEGYCELTTERNQEALASLERAYQLDPEKPETQYFLARAYSALADHGNAVTFLQYALQNGFEPEADARQLLAQEALNAGNVSLALDQYDALTKLPQSALATYRTFVSAALTAGKNQEALVKAEEAVQRWPSEKIAKDLLESVQQHLKQL